MKWEHKCSLDWLKERQGYITASDIKRLLPVTATGRPRKVTDQDRLKVYASKLVDLTEDDCWSFGAAARGHCLEKYAIDELNMNLYDEAFCWWDDVVIHKPGRELAFSPDAMDVPMGESFENATAIAEVKSYSPEKHLSLMYAPKETLEERWQIASAMALCENIDHAYLVLYNPSMASRCLAAICYERNDLEKEIETVRLIERDWAAFKMRFISLPTCGMITNRKGPNESLIKEMLTMTQSVINPV